MISPSGVGVPAAEVSMEGVLQRERLPARDDMRSDGGVRAPLQNEGESNEGERVEGDGQEGEI